MKPQYKYSDIIQDISRNTACETFKVISAEPSLHHDIQSEHVKIKSNNFYTDPHPAFKQKSNALPLVPIANPPWILKTPTTNLFSNVTIKWTGNNKEICKLSIIISQLVLIYLLVNKIAILNSKDADLHRNTSLPLSLGQIDVNSNATMSHEMQKSLDSLNMETKRPSEAEECQEIEASSENEYQSKLENITEQTAICLTIHFRENSYWKLENSSLRLDRVKELILVGNTDTEQLSAVLNKFNFAYKISFGQKYSKFCPTLHGSHMHGISQNSYRSKIYLLNLTEIIFENINCTHSFDYLSKTFFMNAVMSLKIRGIDIDQNNVMGIRQLLKQCKYSLEILDLSEVTWKESLFDNFSYAVPNLKELRIDFLFPMSTNIEFLVGFKSSEHLSKIISTRGYLPYSQFSSIFDFKLIKYLSLGVEITDDVASLDNLFPINVLPKLEYMELFLKFSNTSKCYLLLDYGIERTYETKLHSNCNEDF